ncbi:hypothetical protein [Actinomadura violacea]|uniref:DUF5681 domain-containing protein n=1 Tax=Actinomadura violacea TaxID=2819934 RepID=A0ABS3RY80_9ACTN|nr:hypothetical protein [Actinomadura violacea]MBO2461716.1 hypothetical protein [Actinomadura violacea]
MPTKTTVSEFKTVVRAPFGPGDADNPKGKPKVVARLRGHHDEAEAIAAARAELRELAEWIAEVLDTDDADWTTEVAAKAPGRNVRLVGKGLVAFEPDEASTVRGDEAPDDLAGDAKVADWDTVAGRLGKPAA